MSAIHSSATALLVAVPMVCGLFVAMFRLDELYCRPGQPTEIGHALSDWDEDGAPLCIEPDGKIHQGLMRSPNSDGSGASSQLPCAYPAEGSADSEEGYYQSRVFWKNDKIVI
jgi:hypothetical protein